MERNHANPTATISAPVPFSGRLSHANSPVPMNDQPSTRLTATSAPRASVWLLCATRNETTAPAATPANPIATRARLSALIQHPAEGLAGQLALRDEAARAAARHERPEIGPVAARGEHDRGRVA